MKRILITLFLLFFGMTVFAQDLSVFTEEYKRPDATFAERLSVMEAVRDEKITGNGEFFHDALLFFLLKSPEIRGPVDQRNAELTSVILCQALGAAKYTAAAGDIWQIVELFDVAKANVNNANTMQTALIAMGQVDDKNFVPHVVQRLNNFNTQSLIQPEAKRRAQAAVIGCVSALEALHDIRGYRPVFFVTVGSYDPAVIKIASDALPNITEDPGEVVIEIINDTSSDPRVKLTAWREMLRTSAGGPSKAKVASAALNAGWDYQTQNKNFQTNLREMRKGAIETIRQFGAADDSVYTNLEKSYSNNFINNSPDFDEIMLTLNALTAIKSEPAVALLHKFLIQLHGRRRSGPWARKEQQLYSWVVSCLGKTGTKDNDIRILLTQITRTGSYTPREQALAGDALKELGY